MTQEAATPEAILCQLEAVGEMLRETVAQNDRLYARRRELLLAGREAGLSQSVMARAAGVSPAAVMLQFRAIDRADPATKPEGVAS